MEEDVSALIDEKQEHELNERKYDYFECNYCNQVCEEKFRYWLCEIVRLEQYFPIFVKREYNDITMVEYIDKDVIENELRIKNQTHINCLLDCIEEFKCERETFKAILSKNKSLQQFEQTFIKNGILTINDLTNDIKTNKDLQKILKINNQSEIQSILNTILMLSTDTNVTLQKQENDINISNDETPKKKKTWKLQKLSENAIGIKKKTWQLKSEKKKTVNLHSFWSKCGTQMAVNGTKVAYDNGRGVYNTAYAFASYPLSDGVHEIVFKIRNKDNCGVFIGITTSTDYINGYCFGPGGDEINYGYASYGYKCTNEYRYSAGHKSQQYGVQYSDSDIITAHLNFNNFTIGFSRNGHNFGVLSKIRKRKYSVALCVDGYGFTSYALIEVVSHKITK